MWTCPIVYLAGSIPYSYGLRSRSPLRDQSFGSYKLLGWYLTAWHAWCMQGLRMRVRIETQRDGSLTSIEFESVHSLCSALSFSTTPIIYPFRYLFDQVPWIEVDASSSRVVTFGLFRGRSVCPSDPAPSTSLTGQGRLRRAKNEQNSRKIETIAPPPNAPSLLSTSKAEKELRRNTKRPQMKIWNQDSQENER